MRPAALLDQIARRIRRHCREQGWSLNQFAEHCRASRPAIHQLATKKVIPRLDTLVHVAETLGIEPWELLQPKR